MEKIFVAMDNMDKAARDQFMENLGDAPVNIKLGLEFFTEYGRDGLIEFKNKYKKKIFFDYKLHDIPNTVAKAIKAMEGLPIDYLTIHLSGGREMIKAALLARDQYIPKTKILGVSFLTSLGSSDFSELWNLSGEAADFERLFTIGLEENIDGFILSPNELPAVTNLEKRLGLKALKVTPGIRFEGQEAGDQKRVATPTSAFNDGADFLVMGRALTASTNLKERLSQL
ncbi:MAG: orotidine-5'-phosphate decarboxylase [Bacteriovoracaceae bacterium]|jgi:orotidine-5'-phosphate decarboxylase